MAVGSFGIYPSFCYHFIISLDCESLLEPILVLRVFSASITIAWCSWCSDMYMHGYYNF